MKLIELMQNLANPKDVMVNFSSFLFVKRDLTFRFYAKRLNVPQTLLTNGRKLSIKPKIVIIVKNLCSIPTLYVKVADC